VALEIKIDREACMGSGNCSFWAPGVFDLERRRHRDRARPDGRARRQDRARCAGLPTQAIAVFDGRREVGLTRPEIDARDLGFRPPCGGCSSSW